MSYLNHASKDNSGDVVQRHQRLDILQRGFQVNRLLKGAALGALVGVAGALLAVSTAGSNFERAIGLPWLFHLRGAIKPPPQVAIVAIDGQTGARLGLPATPQEWPRSIHARLVDALIREGASVIAFDILFAKPKLESDDSRLAAAIAQSGRVVLIEKLTGKSQPIIDDTGARKGTVCRGTHSPNTNAAKVRQRTGGLPTAQNNRGGA